MVASRNVEAQALISKTGRVIEAKALSAHVTLRNAAVDAARRWGY
jgi:hypothetical protein